MQLIFTLIFVLAIHSLQAIPTYKFHQTIQSADKDVISSIHQITKNLLLLINRNALFRLIDLQTNNFIDLVIPNNKENHMIKIFFEKQANNNTLIITTLEDNFQKFYVFSEIENSIVESKLLYSIKQSQEQIQTTLNAPFSTMNGSYHDGQRFYHFLPEIRTRLDLESIDESSGLKTMIDTSGKKFDFYSFCIHDEEETIFLGHSGFVSEWRFKL